TWSCRRRSCSSISIKALPLRPRWPGRRVSKPDLNASARLPCVVWSPRASPMPGRRGCGRAGARPFAA
ncbi:MAG: hypothetical protein ACK559_29340, partial [bacterium]